MKKKKVITFFAFLLIIVLALTFLKINVYGSTLGLTILNSTKDPQDYILSPASISGVLIFISILLIFLVYKYIKKHEKRISAQITHLTHSLN